MDMYLIEDRCVVLQTDTLSSGGRVIEQHSNWRHLRLLSNVSDESEARTGIIRAATAHVATLEVCDRVAAAWFEV